MVADMQSLHGWQYWAAVWLGWTKETLKNDQLRDLNTLVEATVVQMSAGGLSDVDDWEVRRFVRVCVAPGAKVLDFCYGNGSIARAMVQLQLLAEIHLADADALAVRAVVGAVNVLREGAPLWLCGSENESIGDAASALQHDFTKSEEIAQDDRFRVPRAFSCDFTAKSLEEFSSVVRLPLSEVGLKEDKLNSGSMSKDMQVLTRKDLQQLSCFDRCWYWSVFAESAVFVSRNPHKMSCKQLCRDMEPTLINVSADQSFSLIESVARARAFLALPRIFRHHGKSNSGICHSQGRVVGCGGGNGKAEHVAQQFHCKEGFLDRCGECEQIFMWLCMMYGLLGIAGIDLVDLDDNEAGMRLSLRITSWSEAGERLRDQGSQVGVERPARQALTPAHQRVCPGGSFGWYGCFRTAPSVQHRIGKMSRSSLSKMPTWKR